ncbi:dihydrolipoamide dehydrogenase [Novimethylophilus kurashikiensis]|uniref:Dihydrolipoyl dehydrogenase n=1 Tax=Novimethylophilus kurashikiensis TaxID=1825523 RepID=A0A2R5F7A1_9PROT|nr:dihydrolipoyl dehydrogenase [Novimethylophilus kurashikiensis]GBG14096.1 dihydrolipoamide dehydrogenase [Novimethylophilus kurashikiensis]
MSQIIEVNVPDIGNFDSVDVIEVHVKPGDSIGVDDSLITLESDKASMDIPSTHAGTVKEVKVKVGDKVAKGSPILTLTMEGAAAAPAPSPAPAAPTPAPAASGSSDLHAEVLVLGAGPGGYTAAFRAADLGKKVVLVERYPSLGGVCLNVGCIPSKALLHAAKVITEAEEMAEHGISFGKPQIDIEKLTAWKEKDVVGKLTGGLSGLAKQRNVTVVNGRGEFTNPNQIAVTSADGKVTTVSFDYAIIAAGSQATKMPGLAPEHQNDPRILDSTSALALEGIPKRMLVVGGGIIGLEMGTVYDAFGAKVSVVELSDGLIPGCDRDLVRPLHKRMEKRFEKIMLKTKVSKLEPKKDGIHVTFEGEQAVEPQVYDKVLVAIGRRPNGKNIGADKAGVFVNEYGFIPVDKQMRTNVPHIFAIGDIVGQPMLAHKAVHEGKVAAEVIDGHKVEFQALAIPSVAYTDPEVAWAGVSETDAKAKGIEIEKASFPWVASGRALSIARTEGMTKLIMEKDTRRIIGAGIVGPNAGELLAEAVLAIEMGADAEDIGLTIHAHPTLSETVCFAAEMAEGTITDLLPPKKR